MRATGCTPNSPRPSPPWYESSWAVIHAESVRAVLRAMLLIPGLVAFPGPVAFADGSNVSMPYDLSLEHPPGGDYMGVRLLGTVRLDAVDVAERYRLTGLSALGYDQDADLLYALSDRGVLFHLRPSIEDGLLVNVQTLAAHPLRDDRGHRLSGLLADAEGMVLKNERNGVAGDTEVLVSFERRPRVIVFRPDGEPTGSVTLPDLLRNRKSYVNGNKGLEALAHHPRHGLVVAPERPLNGRSPPRVELFALESEHSWWYPQPLEPNHALVALEILPDGRLLALERAHGYLFIPFITLLREIPGLPDHGSELGRTRVVARFSTGQGFSLDNFEGLARHREERFFMVSDDNDQTYQATLLSYFQVLKSDRAHALPAAGVVPTP